MTHGELVNRLLLAVSPLGLTWSNASGAAKVDGRLLRYGLKGSSDIILVLAPTGRFIGIEAKVGRDAYRPAQQAFAAALNAAGGLYILARSVDNTGDDAIAYTLEQINA